MQQALNNANWLRQIVYSPELALRDIFTILNKKITTSNSNWI